MLLATLTLARPLDIIHLDQAAEGGGAPSSQPIVLVVAFIFNPAKSSTTSRLKLVGAMSELRTGTGTQETMIRSGRMHCQASQLQTAVGVFITQLN